MGNVKTALPRLKGSVTVWFNALVGALIALLAAIEPNMHLLQSALGDKWPYAMFAVVVINQLLRVKTEVAHIKREG